MQSLDTLPPEILLYIARFTGSDYLRAHVDRLLVAQFVAFENLALSTESLQRFLAAPKRSHLRVLASVRTLSIEGRNYDDYNSPIDAATDPDPLVLESEAENDHHRAQIEAWRMMGLIGNCVFLDLQTCGSLVSLAGYLRHMAELKAFRLKVSMKSPLNEWVDKLLTPAIVSVINSLPRSITSLTIDNPWEQSGFRHGPDDYHQICCLVLSPDFLPSLRHLRLRLRSICPRIFEMNDSAKHPYLETFIINLSRKEPALHQAEGQQSECCLEFGTIKRTPFPELLDAAEATMVRLPAIRTFRILRCIFPMLQVAAHDILTNRQALLPENARWNDLDWIGDEFTDIDVHDQSDVDLFDDSDFDAPWISLEAETAL
ncbi:uncharacterized protein BP5553_03701 [Venustampulla echinocandica]|uniref:F-box domain-containing protein n=1 Tax=Venustampulla echinocandica TaxID=2656787 RepID=A0A370TV10_9HELO|nr:uncharacterized protein BP5553_03701 [Venustampulla echinocandica]RDL39361.1 hypothetical protein BP5553_03701 [Venustampulla echinocandica]